MRAINHFLAIVPIASSLLVTEAQGGTFVETVDRLEVRTRSFPFEAGALEFNISTSAFFSTGRQNPQRPSFNYLQHDLSLGVMLNSPRGDSWYRGNFEFLVDLFGAEIFSGPGNYMGGGRLALRYNFVPVASRWVPFIQIGAGALGNDAYKDRKQRLIGCGFEFLLSGDVGVRYLISDRWALVATARFEHISNADRAGRNLGVNAAGGGLGVSRFF